MPKLACTALGIAPRPHGQQVSTIAEEHRHRQKYLGLNPPCLTWKKLPSIENARFADSCGGDRKRSVLGHQRHEPMLAAGGIQRPLPAAQ